jgi:kelch-like protein 20
MMMQRRDESHPDLCLGAMAQLQREGKLCDVTLAVADELFPAHRVVLAGSSPYFQAMFTGDMEESRASKVTLHDMSPVAMRALLDYCYTASISITQENVQEVLPAADILQLTWVRQQCCEFMQHQLDTSNCLGICAFADTYSCPELHKAAGSFAQLHYLEVLEGGEFLELGTEELAHLLQSEDLNVQSEEQVFESVMRWVGHNVDERKEHLPSVLQYVRLPLLDRSYLVSRVGMEPLIRGSEACRDLVDEAKDYLLLPEQRSLLQGPRTTPRRPVQSNEVMFAVGGWCSGDAISLVERYNPHTEEWKVVATMSKRRCGVGVAVLGDFLYAIGGHDGSSYLNSVERYDPKTNQWTSNLAPTPSCRTSIGVGVLNGLIYTIGGQDGVSCLNLVER